jgi:predicted nucleic acid-binding protein
LADVTPSVAECAAELRAKYQSLRTPDAQQLAAAIEYGCSHFITNDKRLRKVTEIRILVLADYLPPTP